MLFIIGTGEDRPNILETKDKGEAYHLKWARYAASSANNQLHSDYLENIRMNKNFYKGDQWILQEDTEVFLKDDTNQNRNRIKIIQNLIKPMVSQYRGNAIRMQINARAKSVSPQVHNRREQGLSEMKFYTRIANEKENPFKASLKKKLPIGNNEAETEQIFQNTYVDSYVKKINFLLKYVSDLNKFSTKQVWLAEQMALTGLGVIKNYEHSGDQVFEEIESENFFWDRSCKKYDFFDAEFMGDMIYLSPSEIFEMNQNLTSDQRAAIENYSRLYKKAMMGSADGSNSGNTQTNKHEYSGRVPVFNVYWRDGDQHEYGYVRDQFGYPLMTRINYTYEGDENPRYTDADLIEVNTPRAKKLLRGQKKRKLWVDMLRCCSFIPQEILSSYKTEGGVAIGDIALDYGIAPYQESDCLYFNNIQFPYKVNCWGYLDGQVLSPIDDAINPQRMINRLLSVAENQINNSRGAGVFYDKSFVDPQDGEDMILRNMNQSKPVGLNAKGRGMQNAVVPYDSTIKSGTMVMFNIVDNLKGQIQNTTGVNEALKGESTGSDQLVGVTQLLIQRGSLMQEPFYNAISEIFLQCYQAIATVGKRIYIDNERQLSVAIGDDGFEMFQMTRDMKLEDFRVFVKRESMDEMLISAGNQMLFTMLQMGLIDQKRFANLYGRSTPDEVSDAIRAVAKEKEEVGRMQSEKDAADEQEALNQLNMENQQAQEEGIEQQAREDIKDLGDKKHDLNMVNAKGAAKIAENQAKAPNQISETKKELQIPNN